MRVQDIFYKLKYTMRFSILSIFITLFVSSIILLTLIIYLRFSQTISNVAFKFMEQASTTLYDQVDTEFHDIKIEMEMFEQMIKSGIIKIEDVQNLIDYMNILIRVEPKSTPTLQGIYFADETGSFFLVRKSPDGGTETEIINRRQKQYLHTFIYRNREGNIIRKYNSNDYSYDPRVRPWYELAKKEKKFAWTDVYPYHLTADLGITAAKPVLSDRGELKGIIAYNLRLDYIRHFIENMQISQNGIVYIISVDGKVIAFPHLSQYQTGRLVNVHELKLPWVIASFAGYKKHLHNQFKFQYKGENYLAFYRRFPYLGTANQWLIGMVAPEKDFTAELRELNLLVLIISVIILLFGILLMSRLVNRIVNPLKNVVNETEKIKNFELDNKPPLQSRINEINTLSQAIDRMKQGLRSFKKYVPANLVRQLIESGRDVLIGGEKKQLAICFSDIENFTSISEKMDPGKLMEFLCEYFNEISPIIVENSGTIDKYIGDSAMAFWGAPIPEYKPCHLAAQTALSIIERVKVLNERWVLEGKPALHTRIGLHFGEAIVGNLGSNDRLNYTAIGDVINTTSRLEGINKVYHTKIVVSDAFYKEIADDFALRLVDFVALRGRQHGTYIYELMAKSSDELSFNLADYQKIFAQGFAAYQQQQWDIAISHFQSCLTIYPSDAVTPILIKRCQHFKVNPPGPDWNGIWRMHGK